MKIQRMDHVGIIVNDLAAAKAFFLDLGFEVVGEEFGFEGEWIDRIVGLNGAKTEAVMLSLPGNQTNLELARFLAPPDEKGVQRPLANTLGIRHISFAVDDIEASGHQTEE